MRLLDNRTYLARLKRIADEDLGWEKLVGKTVLITGATGTIGKMLIDVLMYKNWQMGGGRYKVVAVGRNEEKARRRLGDYFGDENFEFLQTDISENLEFDGRVDFVVQAASATDPLVFAQDPVGTIMPNVIGLNNVARLAVDKKAKLVFLSSVEVYGENKSEKDKFCETDLGYIDCNTLRAGYPEAKRLGETLLQAYKSQYGLDFTTLRLARVFGPTMLRDNIKSTSQFIMNAVRGEDIVMKTAGKQKFSYVYAADAVRATIWALARGEDGEAYNVADEAIDIDLRGFAEGCAKYSDSQVIFQEMSTQERKVYSTFTKLLMDTGKLTTEGLVIRGDFDAYIKETIEIMGECG